jgi:hypothetical protein
MDRNEMTTLRETVQELAVQVGRLTQAVEPLVRLQEEQGRLRETVAALEGFRAAVIWMLGLVGVGAIGRYLALAVVGR